MILDKYSRYIMTFIESIVIRITIVMFITITTTTKFKEPKEMMKIVMIMIVTVMIMTMMIMTMMILRMMIVTMMI